MEKQLSEVTLVCPECGSHDIHIVVGEKSGQAVFADDVFDDRDDAMCGDCHHKDQSADFISCGVVTAEEAAEAAKLAFAGAQARWASAVAEGRGTECVIESTDIFDALNDLGFPCNTATEAVVEAALCRLGCYKQAAETFKAYQATNT